MYPMCSTLESRSHGTASSEIIGKKGASARPSRHSEKVRRIVKAKRSAPAFTSAFQDACINAAPRTVRNTIVSKRPAPPGPHHDGFARQPRTGSGGEFRLDGVQVDRNDARRVIMLRRFERRDDRWRFDRRRK